MPSIKAHDLINTQINLSFCSTTPWLVNLICLNPQAIILADYIPSTVLNTNHRTLLTAFLNISDTRVSASSVFAWITPTEMVDSYKHTHVWQCCISIHYRMVIHMQMHNHTFNILLLLDGWKLYCSHTPICKLISWLSARFNLSWCQPLEKQLKYADFHHMSDKWCQDYTDMSVCCVITCNLLLYRYWTWATHIIPPTWRGHR